MKKVFFAAGVTAWLVGVSLLVAWYFGFIHGGNGLGWPLTLWAVTPPVAYLGFVMARYFLRRKRVLVGQGSAVRHRDSWWLLKYRLNQWAVRAYAWYSGRSRRTKVLINWAILISSLWLGTLVLVASLLVVYSGKMEISILVITWPVYVVGVIVLGFVIYRLTPRRWYVAITEWLQLLVQNVTKSLKDMGQWLLHQWWKWFLVFVLGMLLGRLANQLALLEQIPSWVSVVAFVAPTWLLVTYEGRKRGRRWTAKMIWPIIVWPLLRVLFGIRELWDQIVLIFWQIVLVDLIAWIVAVAIVMAGYAIWASRTEHQNTLKLFLKRVVIIIALVFLVRLFALPQMSRLPWAEWIVSIPNFLATVATIVLWGYIFFFAWLDNPLAVQGLLDEKGHLIFDKKMHRKHFTLPVNRWWGVWFPLLKLVLGEKFEPKRPMYAFDWLINPTVDGSTILRIDLGCDYPGDPGAPETATGGKMARDYHDWLTVNGIGWFGSGFEQITKVKAQKGSPMEKSDPVPTSWHWFFDTAYAEFQVVSRGEHDVYHVVPFHFRGMKFLDVNPDTGKETWLDGERAFITMWFYMTDAAGDISKKMKDPLEIDEQRQLGRDYRNSLNPQSPQQAGTVGVTIQ